MSAQSLEHPASSPGRDGHGRTAAVIGAICIAALGTTIAGWAFLEAFRCMSDTPLAWCNASVQTHRNDLIAAVGCAGMIATAASVSRRLRYPGLIVAFAAIAGEVLLAGWTS